MSPDCHAEGRGFESLQPLSKRPAFAGRFASGSRLVRLLQQTMNRQSWRPELPRAPEKEPICRPSLSPEHDVFLPAADGRGLDSTGVRLRPRRDREARSRHTSGTARLPFSASWEQQQGAGRGDFCCSSAARAVDEFARPLSSSGGKRRLSGLTPPTGHFIGRVFRDTEAPEATEPPCIAGGSPVRGSLGSRGDRNAGR